jgi:tetratricopeptide (TPR) repeat protein
VVGKRFTLQALRSLIDDPAYGCDALVASDLVRPESSDYLFAHALIQEGIYSSLLNSRKRELHRRAAAWFGERDLTLRADHLDRAEDPAAAQAYLLAAQDEARRFRYDTALRLAERGAQLASAGPVRCELALQRGELLREIGRSQDSIVAFRGALELAQEDGQQCRAWMGIAGGNRVTGEFALAMDALDQAEPIAQRLGLAADRARIRHTRGNLFFAQGNVAACRGEHEAALDLARQAGDPECEAQALSGLGDAQYARGRMLSALGFFIPCVRLCEEHGMTRAEVVNRAMVGHCLHYKNELDGALSELLIACELASRAGLVQGEILAQESLGLIHLARGEHSEAEVALTRSLSLARSAGARRYQSVDLYLLALLRIKQGQRNQARERLSEALELARQTGMGFLGAAVFGALGLAADAPEERKGALQEGENLLRQDCVGHCYYWFYRDAIDATLAAEEWDEAVRYTDALEEYARAEPLPWVRLSAARARALAAAGKRGLDAALLSDLKQLRAEVERVALGSALPALDAALARA